jgi:hypothetical protein
MILGVIKRISRDDLAKTGEALPKWLDTMLTPLNDFIEKVGLALQTRLTFKDNFLGKVFESKFTHNTELEINPYPAQRGALRVIGVVPVSTGSVFITGFKWLHKSNGNIGVTIKFDGATEGTVRLQIQLE